MTANRADLLVDRARHLADDVLFPIAQTVDQSDRVPASSLSALADAGMFALAGSPAQGGLDGDPEAAWRVSSLIGGACAATFFVWVQHHHTVRLLVNSPNAQLAATRLPELCAGETIAGVAFAHLRRPGPPAITATRVEGGWRFDGFSPWTTSWGIADWFTIGGESDDGRVVWAIVPGHAPDGIVATPLRLPVFMSTGTVSLRLDNCVVPDGNIAAIESADEWRLRDRSQAALGNPVTHGLARRAARLLAEIGEHDPDAAQAAQRIDEECEDRAQAFDDLLAELDDSDDYIRRASDHRAACIHLAQRSATALLAAAGGRGMDLEHPAQRIAREANFFVIQAQTADGRAATLRSI